MPRIRTQDPLAGLASAINRRHLSAAQVQALAMLLAAVQQASSPDRFEAATLRNLKVAATQIRDIRHRASSRSLDAASFGRLPPGLRSRVLKRLDNVARRLGALSQAARGHGRSDRAFRCVLQHAQCRARADGGTELWCHLALIVCLLRSLAPIVTPRT